MIICHLPFTVYDLNDFNGLNDLNAFPVSYELIDDFYGFYDFK